MLDLNSNISCRNNKTAFIAGIRSGDEAFIDRAIEIVENYDLTVIKMGRLRQNIFPALKSIRLSSEQKDRLVNKFIFLVDNSIIKNDMREYLKLILGFNNIKLTHWAMNNTHEKNKYAQKYFDKIIKYNRLLKGGM